MTVALRRPVHHRRLFVLCLNVQVWFYCFDNSITCCQNQIISCSWRSRPTSSEIQAHWSIVQTVESTLYCVCNPLWSKISAVKNKWPSDYNSHSAITGVPSPCLYSLLCYFTVYDFPWKLVKMWCCVAQWVQAPQLTEALSLVYASPFWRDAIIRRRKGSLSPIQRRMEQSLIF